MYYVLPTNTTVKFKKLIRESVHCTVRRMHLGSEDAIGHQARRHLFLTRGVHVTEVQYMPVPKE